MCLNNLLIVFFFKPEKMHLNFYLKGFFFIKNKNRKIYKKYQSEKYNI